MCSLHIAGRHGIDAVDASDKRSIIDDWYEGEKRGVKGSPHFFCREHDAFCPSLEISKDGTGQLEVNPNLDVLDAFLTRCFRG
jgi:hypothetical protein